MEDFIIKEIIKEDNNALAYIVKSVLTEFNANKQGTVYYDPTTDDLFSLFQTPGSNYFVVKNNDKVVGGAGVYPTPNLPVGCCELVKLYLLSTVRSKGLGRLLIEKCFVTAKEYGYSQIYLETMPELSMAVGLYEKCGFNYLPNFLGNFGHFGCDVWMIKNL